MDVTFGEDSSLGFKMTRNEVRGNDIYCCLLGLTCLSSLREIYITRKEERRHINASNNLTRETKDMRYKLTCLVNISKISGVEAVRFFFILSYVFYTVALFIRYHRSYNKLIFSLSRK